MQPRTNHPRLGKIAFHVKIPFLIIPWIPHFQPGGRGGGRERRLPPRREPPREAAPAQQQVTPTTIRTVRKKKERVDLEIILPSAFELFFRI